MAQWSLLCFEKELKKMEKELKKIKVVPLLVFACDKKIALNLLLLLLLLWGVGWGGGNV